MNIKDDLTEREKELDCLYEIAALLAGVNTDDEDLMKGFADSLTMAMTYPDSAKVNITSGNGECLFGPEKQDASFFSAESLLENGEVIKINVWYDPPSGFVEREKKLVISAVSLLANALSKKNYYRKLEVRTEELKSKNAALKEILFQIDQDREEYVQSTRKAAESLLLPLICELEDTSLSPRQEGLVKQLKMQLESLVGSIEENLKFLSEILSPREIEVCSLIKNGASTKEIALFLNISPQTVERHRNTIRKKLGINKKSINLVMHLRNM